MELGKVPPQDIEAEQAVIGSMLTDQDAVIAAVEVLKAEDFYREDNKIIYDLEKEEVNIKPTTEDKTEINDMLNEKPEDETNYNNKKIK